MRSIGEHFANSRRILECPGDRGRGIELSGSKRDAGEHLTRCRPVKGGRRFRDGYGYFSQRRIVFPTGSVERRPERVRSGWQYIAWARRIKEFSLDRSCSIELDGAQAGAVNNWLGSRPGDDRLNFGAGGSG